MTTDLTDIFESHFLAESAMDNYSFRPTNQDSL